MRTGITSVFCVGALAACGAAGAAEVRPSGDAGGAPDVLRPLSTPLVLVADVDLPGRANRFDYQDVDAKRGQLVVAHMNDASVLVLDMKDGSVLRLLPNIPTARGVAVASDIGRVFVTSAPNQLVIIDSDALTEVARVTTGSGPDGVAWDPTHKVVGVSDQGDGALSILRDAGSGARVQVPLGAETGNVVFDGERNVFWITVVTTTGAGELVAVDPVAASVATRIALRGCSGAHGLRIHPDGKSALIACEGDDKLARVELSASPASPQAIVLAATGAGPDVLAIDPGLGWLYVAAESGDLVVFDLTKPGLVALDRSNVGSAAHTVAVDPGTHRVFFPLVKGPAGTPVLRIMRPSGD